MFNHSLSGLALSSILLCGVGNAQTERSIVFHAEDEGGNAFVLSLADQDFDHPTCDGSLEFTGSIQTPQGASYQVTLKSNLRLLTNATQVSNSTISSATRAIGHSQDGEWIAVTEKAPMPEGSVSETHIEESTAGSQLFVVGDFADLADATHGMHNAGNLELALAQSLAFLITTNSSDGPGEGRQMNLASCTNAAKGVCDSDCVKSVTFEVTYNEDGDVASTSCTFECKEPCP